MTGGICGGYQGGGLASLKGVCGGSTGRERLHPCTNHHLKKKDQRKVNLPGGDSGRVSGHQDHQRTKRIEVYENPTIAETEKKARASYAEKDLIPNEPAVQKEDTNGPLRHLKKESLFGDVILHTKKGGGKNVYGKIGIN